ncbi:MAG: DUF4340 domain-containing protein [Clostridia bacterium]|nr:DUF4340 domain-containing protein [Clostridia bacterium]
MAQKQRKKKNKYLPMIVLAAILAVLVIGTSVLSAANEKKAAEEAAELAASQNTSILLAEYDASTTKSISYSREGEEFLTFLAENGAWVYEGDREFPLNQETVGYMASALSSMAAIRTVDEVDKDAYGLTDPAYVIKVEYTDGTSHVYNIGAYNSFTGGYYFTMDGDCYLISSGLIPYFDYALEDLLALDTIPVSEWQDIGYVSSVTVTKDGVSNEITDEAGMTEALEKLGGVSLTICEDYSASAEEKASYGIDGTNSVSVKYKKAVTSTDANGNESTNYLETTYTFDIGSADGAYYGGPAKSGIVYSLTADAVDALLAYAAYVPAEAAE